MQLVTTILVVVNVIVFLLMFKENSGALWNPPNDLLIRAGADYGPLFANGQWWRSISSGFVHIGMLHLLLNLYVLARIGGDLENQIGFLKYLMVYFIAMIAGSLLSSYIQPYIVSAGASGAIFGLLGCQLVALTRLWKEIPKGKLAGLAMSYALLLFLYIAIGSFFPRINNWDHLGGLLGGIVASLVLLPLDEKKKAPNLFNAIGIFAIAFGLWVGNTYVMQRDKQAADAMTAPQLVEVDKMLKEYTIPFWLPTRVGSPVEAIGSACLQCPDYKTAIEMADKEVDLDKQNGHGYYTRALVQHKFGHDTEALGDINKALSIVPGDYDFLLLRARIEILLKHFDDATSDAQSAMKTDRKEHAVAADIAGSCRLAQGDRKGAISYFNKAIREDADLGSAYYHRAIAHQMLGDKIKSQQDFIRAQDRSYVPDQWDTEQTTHDRHKKREEINHAKPIPSQP
jgi:rhomboid protease GluP